MLAQDKTFCFGVPGGSATIEISAEGLRGILSQVEAELYRSEIYQRAVTNLQPTPPTGSSGQFLLKAVEREAIRLALRHFVRQAERSVEPSTEPSTALVSVASSFGVAPLPAVSVSTTSPAQLLSSAIAQLKPAPKPPAADPAIAAQAHQAAVVALGQQIQQARQARSLSLAAVHLKSLVPMHHLKAIEAGDLEHLPALIYLRGFIQRLAPVVGLDSNTLLATLPTVAATPYVLPHVGLMKSQSGHNPAFLGIAGAPLYLGYAALMAGGFAWLSQQSAPKSTLPPLEVDTPHIKASRSPVPATAHSATLPANNFSPAVTPTRSGKTIANIAPPETVKF